METPAGFSAFLVADSTQLSAFLANDSAAKAAYGSGGTTGAANLQAYLLATPTAVSAYLGSGAGQAALQAYLVASPSVPSAVFVDKHRRHSRRI